MSVWKNTDIWKKLDAVKNDEADKIKAFLLADFCMDKIETVLNKGASSPKDFTLHDADHSFRVAQRMWEIIPHTTKDILSEYELAILLLSAYLHDIGMTPNYNKVSNHYRYLRDKIKKNLDEKEKHDFQLWLDEQGEFINLDEDVIEDEEKIEELVTFYCRHKHNDWSEDWIKKNFKNKSLANYNNWINDLCSICKSHHYGYEELKSENYNPIRIGEKIVHKRYIAMCLRLGDVMEIDPERAPAVLIKHRNIIDGSMSHWLKEKFTSVVILEDYVSVTASPTKAFIHKAILDVADQIEHETNLCNRLQSEVPLRNMAPLNNLPHQWNIKASIHKEIKEGGDYEFIEGTFKPNSKKILDLLAGTSLYGNPLFAIREIIQNSIDAIKVQMAYKAIDEGISDIATTNELMKRHQIDINIYKKGKDIWLSCSDNGVGMDKDIIKKCFLVGGSSKRAEILQLERKSKANGHDFNITGKFGIGVLSYFMIADKVIVNTKKNILSGSLDSNGWEFEINGLSDFGELRKTGRKISGTKIDLRIRKELVQKIYNRDNIIHIINNYLIKIPCKINVHFEGKLLSSYSPGWIKDIDFYKRKLFQQYNSKTTPKNGLSDEFISEETFLNAKNSFERKQEVDDRFNNSIDFISKEGQLKNNYGQYRITIPIFKNKKGDCLAFLFENQNNSQVQLQRINGGFLFYPKNEQIMLGWKGISVKYIDNNRRTKNCFIELDLTNDDYFNISVSRLDINHGDVVKEILQEIDTEVNNLIKSNQKRFATAEYNLINHIANPSINATKYYWVLENTENKDCIHIEKVKFPLIFVNAYSYDRKERVYMGKKVNKLYSLPETGEEYHSTFSIEDFYFKFDKAVYNYNLGFGISFLIENKLVLNTRNSFFQVPFPDGWNNLLCYKGFSSGELIFNKNHGLYKHISSDGLNLIKAIFKGKQSLSSDDVENIVGDKSLSSSLILYVIIYKQYDIWNGLIRHKPDFIKKIISSLFKNNSDQILFSAGEYGDTSIHSISLEGIQQIERPQDFLPLPSDDWKILEKE